MSPSLWQPPVSSPADLSDSDRSTLEQRLGGLAARFGGPASAEVALALSLQAEDLVLLDAAARLGLGFTPFVLETGRLHDETLAYLDVLRERYGPIALVKPDPASLAAYEAREGRFAFYESLGQRLACCALRKVAPLGQALVGYGAWVTGQRREQAATRAALALEEWDEGHGLLKANPLADWSERAVWHYLRAHDVPAHPLYARGYASIGCEPCTRAVRAGEPIRAGRWWWEQADGKECGLHPIARPERAAGVPA